MRESSRFCPEAQVWLGWGRERAPGADSTAEESGSPWGSWSWSLLRGARASVKAGGEQPWPRCFPGAATTTTKDGFGSRRASSSPGWWSGPFLPCSAPGSTKLPCRGCPGSLSPHPWLHCKSQFDFPREKVLPSESADLMKSQGENSSQ